jgi:hypothetical protein
MPDGDFPCCAPRPDPEVSAEGRAAAAGFLEDQARALGRAYQARGDQLSALEAEAAADQHQADRRRLLRCLFGREAPPRP